LLDYVLPRELIAQEPAPGRSDSRLLVLDRSTGALTDSRFNNIGRFLRPGDCLVLNDTKVVQSRFFARRPTGGGLEGLFLAEDAPGLWRVLLKRAGRVKKDQSILLLDRAKQPFCAAEVAEKEGQGRFLLELSRRLPAEKVLSEIGFPPLPPYIKRDDDPARAAVDSLRYQTVYAKNAGAVAAPTAGLHFTEELIETLAHDRITLAYLTLHVGTGTFKPITTDEIEKHRMHAEWFSLDQANADKINRTKQQGGRVVAVGTTSVRVLETVAADSNVRPARGTTDLFIKPGYTFKVVDAIVTNFHLPRTTLLALVAAFAGLEQTLAAYRHAVERKYRFYSYGDAMLIV